MIKEFKKAIQEWAELCGMEIRLMRKSKNYDVIFVHGVNEGEYAGLDLNDFLNGNHSQWKKELNKGFNRPMPKIVRTYIDPEYLTETKETEETPVSSEQNESNKETLIKGNYSIEIEERFAKCDQGKPSYKVTCKDITTGQIKEEMSDTIYLSKNAVNEFINSIEVTPVNKESKKSITESKVIKFDDLMKLMKAKLDRF
ncbi:hypothetical protein V7128_02020 [Neobacillus vireti]|uniref:hypothetical protein n=1 Tax=Neobacillus vireti TaxID=220686 RepID=UPI002FFEF103